MMSIFKIGYVLCVMALTILGIWSTDPIQHNQITVALLGYIFLNTMENN